jgi:hypothetical protein
MRRTAVVALLILICGVVLLGVVTAGDGLVIGRAVIGGGGREAKGDGYAVSGTIGEPIASGLQVGSGYGFSSGFWRPGPARMIYLPLVQRESVP